MDGIFKEDMTQTFLAFVLILHILVDMSRLRRWYLTQQPWESPQLQAERVGEVIGKLIANALTALVIADLLLRVYGK